MVFSYGEGAEVAGGVDEGYLGLLREYLEVVEGVEEFGGAQEQGEDVGIGVGEMRSEVELAAGVALVHLEEGVEKELLDDKDQNDLVVNFHGAEEKNEQSDSESLSSKSSNSEEKSTPPEGSQNSL